MKKRSPLQKLLTFAAYGLFAVLAVIAVVRVVTSWQASQVEARFRRALGGKALGDLFPPQTANETARTLDELLLSLGLAPSEAKIEIKRGQGPFTTERRAALREILDPQNVPEEGSVAALKPLGAEGRALLDEVRPTLDRAVALLSSSFPPPTWPRDLSLGAEVVVPNTFGLFDLQKLLIADAHERARGGEEAAAYERLEASWRLNQAVLDDPYLVSQMIGSATTRLQVGLLRSLAAPAPWRERLATIELRNRRLTALRTEANLALVTARSDRANVWGPKFISRFLLVDHARRMERRIEQLAASDVRTFDPAEFDRVAQKEIPRWQLYSRLSFLPDTWQNWTNAAEVELAAELAALGIDERARYAAGAPPRGFDRKPSRVEGIEWIFREVTEGDRPGTWIEPSAEMKTRSEKALPTRLFVTRESRVP